MGIKEDIAKFRESRDRGLGYLIGIQGEDGSFGKEEEGVDAYYKIPYLFAITGHNEKGLKLLDWIEKYHLTDNGDFRSQSRKGMSEFHSYYYTYANCWPVKGAQKLGRFDISFKGVKFLLKHQDKKLGGFRGRLFSDPDPTLEVHSTAWCGLALLYTGYVEPAVKGGDFLIKMLDEQPEIEDYLYVNYHPEEGIITEGIDDFFLGVSTHKEKQFYVYPGMAMAFLSKLYLATGEERFLKAAQKYLDFALSCQEDVLASPPSGKLAFGASTLFTITGEERARDAALKISRYLLTIQNPDGSWSHPWNPDTASYGLIDLTAEFTLWLTEIIYNLSAKE